MSEYHGSAGDQPVTAEDVAQGATDDIQHGCFGVITRNTAPIAAISLLAAAILLNV